MLRRLAKRSRLTSFAPTLCVLFLCVLVATADDDGALPAAEHVLLMPTGCAAVQSRHTGVSLLLVSADKIYHFWWG